MYCLALDGGEGGDREASATYLAVMVADGIYRPKLASVGWNSRTMCLFLAESWNEISV